MDYINEIYQKQKAFFRTGKTKDINFRKQQLMSLRKAIDEHEAEILEALKKDLNKPAFEAYVAEIGIVTSEIDLAIKNISSWAKPKKVKTPLIHFLASSYIQSEPYGLVLIIAPWNYPFQLLINPLIASIAAGNCCILKPSELAPATSKVSAKIIRKIFNEQYVALIEGAVEETKILLNLKFDYIFFTGGTEVGKIIYQAAAKHLTPVTLELGGKNPCIIDSDTDLTLTARRIAWGKFMNAGQICLAPDYLFIERKFKEPFLNAFTKEIESFYGKDASLSKDYARIINERHFDRINNLLKGANVIFGGQTKREDKYISPTLIETSEDSAIMKEEIFGPVLPVMIYDDINEVVSYINERAKPLALYLFSKNKKLQDKIVHETSSGGVCINETIIHISNPHLPFGGVGDSGIGAYHGKAGFDLFSHKKSVLNRSFLFDLKLRYAPYNQDLKLIKLLMKKLM
jgi:aldehyde dehydrogenase (NAD+)